MHYARAQQVQVSKAKRSVARVRADESIALDAQGALRVVVVADTHSHPHPNTARLIAALAPAAILHAGDIGDLNVLAQLRALAPVIAVRGNIDERARELPDVVTLDIRAGEQSVLKLLLMHIAVYGPKVRADAARLAHESGAKLIVCGHSHVPFVGRDKGLTVFNPGSVGPRRMQLPILFGVLQIELGKLSLRHVDCETGRDWAP